jgi:DNA repair exonuclease SbcCD ATPase subunit
MHVHQLTAENFKRLQLITITFPPGGGTFEIAGANSVGKTSAIDAVFAALGGKDASPEQPIRAGQRSGRVVLELGEYRVTREWDARGTRLTVTGADGARVGSPQTLLDGLFARLAFDPLDFTRQGGRAQAETLRRVAGLDFAELDRRRAGAFAERTDVNRAVRRQEAVVAELPEVAETAEIDRVGLSARLSTASRHNVQLEQALGYVKSRREDAEDAEDEVAALERKLEQARARRDQRRAVAEQAAAALAQLGPEIDTAPILEEIAEIDQTNRRARAYRERRAATEQLRANRAHAEELTLDLDRIDAERARLLAEAPMPVAGLSLDGDTVTFGGVPFAQASAAEQVRVSLAIAAALNPRLRLVVIREGSLLDGASLRLVAAWAQEHDYQVLVERVADSTLGPGVVIEEGRVKDQAPAEAAGRLFA